MNFKFQISNFKFWMVALVGIALSSCSLKENEYQVSDLQGLWLEDNTEHYVRFTTDQSDEAGYLLGREWDLAEDVHEQDLIAQYERDHRPGNGWFKYWLKTNGDLMEFHYMDNDGAIIPKVYIVTTLTKTKLAYYEKDQKSNKFSFTKQ